LCRDDLKELLHVLELLLQRVLQLLQMLQLLGHTLQNLEDLLNRLAERLRRREWAAAHREGPVRRESKRNRLGCGIRDWRTKAKGTSSHEASFVRQTIVTDVDSSVFVQFASKLVPALCGARTRRGRSSKR
jgi:hypothetical protein